MPDQWQFWDTTGGNWWSSKAISCTGGTPDPFTLAPGGGGPPFTAPAAVAAGCPNAVVAAIGVTVGSFNPGYAVAVDGVHFQTATQSTTWDFGPKWSADTTRDAHEGGPAGPPSSPARAGVPGAL